MSLPYRIREAALDDNDRLIELARRSPYRGRLDVVTDRYPDYFAITRLQGERSFVYVAEEPDGEIVAAACFFERREWRDGAFVKVLVFADLRTDPRVRRSRIASQLIEVYTGLLRSGSYAQGGTEVMRGNLAPLRALKHTYDGIHVQREGRVKVYQLLPYFLYRSSPRWSYRQAVPEDAPALSELLQARRAEVEGAPDFSLEALSEALDQHHTFKIEQLWVATDKTGQVAACLGLWDQSSLRRSVPLRFSRSLRFGMRILGLLGLAWQLPPLPRVGRPMRYSYLRWLAERPGESGALRHLIRFTLHRMRSEARKQFVVVGFHEVDRQRHVLRGILRFKEFMHIYSHRLTEAKPMSLPSHPHQRAQYVDLSLS